MINSGDLLISTPESLGDYYFNRSIIILTEVSNEEVVGFIINKELNYSLKLFITLEFLLLAKITF